MANTSSTHPLLKQGTAAPASSSSSFGGALGVVAIVIGIGVLGGYMLDFHAHRCEGCGHTWRHLGAFNLGDPDAHSCARCGTVQWWKDGMPHVFRDALRAPPSDPVGVRWRQLALAAPWERLGGGG